MSGTSNTEAHVVAQSAHGLTAMEDHVDTEIAIPEASTQSVLNFQSSDAVTTVTRFYFKDDGDAILHDPIDGESTMFGVVLFVAFVFLAAFVGGFLGGRFAKGGD